LKRAVCIHLLTHKKLTPFHEDGSDQSD